MIARLIAIALGIWLIIAPAVLEHSEPAADNNRTIGPINASLAFVALWTLGRPLRWATLPLGAWLIAAPLFIIYGNTLAVVNTIVAGLCVCAAALVNDPNRYSFGGGWRSLRQH